MVLVQKWPFFQLFFLGNIGQENVFYEILEQKNTCLSYKNKKFKNSKNSNFFKRVNLWCWSKNGYFFKFLFQAIQARKMSFTIIQNEKALFYAIKTRSSKSRKIDIFPKRLTRGLGEKWPFFYLSFFGNTGQENVFLVLVQKWPLFQLLFFRQYRPGNVFYDILERKKGFSTL